MRLRLESGLQKFLYLHCIFCCFFVCVCVCVCVVFFNAECVYKAYDTSCARAQRKPNQYVTECTHLGRKEMEMQRYRNSHGAHRNLAL